MLEFIKPFNFILAADAYKATHYKQLQNTRKFEKSYSVVVPRKSNKYSTDIVAMGQTLVASLLESVRIKSWMIDEAELEINEQGYEFNRKDWEIIAYKFHGQLPLSVFGVEEGRVVKPQTPILGIINTDDRFAWLPAYTETIIQEIIWKMSTVATICRSIRGNLAEYIELTGADINQLDYMLHNFGDRGADSPDEAPIMAGIAHAALFNGSDCLRVNGYIKRLYHTKKAYTSSIDATEHSVMVANSDSKNKNDFGAAEMAVDQLYDAVTRSSNGIGIPALSVVIDTYNSRRFVKEFLGTILKDRIINSGGKLICRPDSGDITIEPGLVGKDIENTFGVTINEKGYKVLPKYIGVIQGDGNKIDTYKHVLNGWVNAGFSMDNFCIGMGSGITHDGSRDDFSFSMKSIANQYQSKWYSSLKEPNTDITKKSLSGLVRCEERLDGTLEVYNCLDRPETNLYTESNGWRLWFSNGYSIYKQTFDEVRERARA